MISDRESLQQLETKYPHLFDALYSNHYIRTVEENRRLRDKFVALLAEKYGVRLDKRDGLPVNIALRQKILLAEAEQNLFSAMIRQFGMTLPQCAANGWKLPDEKRVAQHMACVKRQLLAGGKHPDDDLASLGSRIERAANACSKHRLEITGCTVH